MIFGAWLGYVVGLMTVINVSVIAGLLAAGFNR
jgi:hypothetical protein